MYTGKHIDVEKAVESFNEDVKAYIDLYYEQMYNCGFNPERVCCWNELVREFREYRVWIVKLIYDNRIRTAVLGTNGRYELVGPLA